MYALVHYSVTRQLGNIFVRAHLRVNCKVLNQLRVPGRASVILEYSLTSSDGNRFRTLILLITHSDVALRSNFP